MNINQYIQDFAALEGNNLIGNSALLTVLRAIYGEDRQCLYAQTRRYLQILQAYKASYGVQEAIIARAPGRVDLMGSHTDYHQGYVFPMALDQDTVTIAGRRADKQVIVHNTNPAFTPHNFLIEPAIGRSERGSWDNYVKAGAQALVQHYGSNAIGGMNVMVDGNPPYGVPLAAGLSSSSSLLISTTIALTHLNEISMAPKPFARFCGEAEWYVGTHGGFMDHFAAILSQRNHALFMDCRPVKQIENDADATFLTENIPFPEGYDVLVCNTNVKKEKSASSEYNTRVLELKVGLEFLKPYFPEAEYLRDIPPHTPLQEMLPAIATPNELRQQIEPHTFDALLHEYNLAPSRALKILARCRHVLSENARVLQGCDLLKAGDMQGFGAVMTASYQSIRDDFEASCPELDEMINIILSVPGTTGARIAGAGWGGCAVALVERSATLEFQKQIAEQYMATTGIHPSIFSCHPGQGAEVMMF